jgi:hypothetical protein
MSPVSSSESGCIVWSQVVVIVSSVGNHIGWRTASTNVLGKSLRIGLALLG